MKVSKFSAGYVDPQPQTRECDDCPHFIKPRACAHVEGDIDPKGCCDLFPSKNDPVRKAKKKAQATWKGVANGS
jgi:hypothetical protein